MKSFNETYAEENAYLSKTLGVASEEAAKESQNLSERKSSLISARKDMWENTAHYSTDFNKMTEVNQHLTEITNMTSSYSNALKRIHKLEKMAESPYFGRFDFIEEGLGTEEKIYVGLYNLMESKTGTIYVYDWRAPVSSIFYRFEPGKASYSAPCGEVSGEVLMKRQYKIEDSKLKYFFDCSVRINDEVLQEVLSRNSSVKMRNIVKTIQKEQDLIIRDAENELLIVQGVAGSGKTSIALHRIAFLLYEGIESRLDANNIMVVSPNAIFSKYISSVLPELGEENVEQITVDEILIKYLGENTAVETRNNLLDSIISCKDASKSQTMRQSLGFKGSKAFVTVLDRLIDSFEQDMIEFEDVIYDGTTIYTRQELKSLFLNNMLSTPMAKRLKRLENMILEKIRPLQSKRLEQIEKEVEEAGGHEFEIQSYSRLLSIKESKVFTERLHRFTEINILSLYKRLFSEEGLFQKLARELDMPQNLQQIIEETELSLGRGLIRHEDALALLYLKLRIEGEIVYTDIKQVVIDEAQDYYYIHYKIFKLLFGGARFTVMGDIRQSIEKTAEASLYDEIISILDKKKTVKLTLNKSYRASFEINSFARKILNIKQDFIAFERHEEKPELIFEESEEVLIQRMVKDVQAYLDQGFETIAIICKTRSQARELYSSMSGLYRLSLVDVKTDEIDKGVMILPVYMAKGLEFDAVMVYGVDDSNYSDNYDRKLLYIACTRALHRLSLYYSDKKSRLL